MAFYDNKYWLLSHIRNSFITTDDTGMCELIMMGEGKDVKSHLAHLKVYPGPDKSEDESDEDEFESESFNLSTDMNFGLRQRSNTAICLEKLDQARRKAEKIKHVKWENHKEPVLDEEIEDLFRRKDLNINKNKVCHKSMLSERLEQFTNVPLNPYMEYAIFDGSGQVNIPVRKYRIFLTMLPEDERNYPIQVSCIATARIEELIGLILLKFSTTHGDFPLKPVNHYGLYITEDDGEVDSDFPCLDARECVAKFGFTCLGLVEHGENEGSKSVSFEDSESLSEEFLRKRTRDTSKIDKMKQITNDLQLMDGHNKAMEAPLYQSYRVNLVNKVRVRTEIHLGISGEKIEIDPVQQKSSKFSIIKQKAISHHMDTIAWCEITDSRSSRSNFRVVYSLSFVPSDLHYSGKATSSSFPPSLQTSASFKHYDFEADNTTAEEIVQKINLILELRSSVSRKEYIAAKERKHYKRKSFNLNK